MHKTYSVHNYGAKMSMFCIVMFIAVAVSAQVREFEVISRRPVPTGGVGFMGLTRNNTPAFFQMANEGGKAVYKVIGTTSNVTIDALSYIDYARQADRIVTYGDSLDKHVVTNAYVRFYSGSGTLIKSLEAIAYWPFAATLAENGDFIIAGNKDKIGGNPQMFVASFDKDGNKLWERSLPNMLPQRVYSAPDRKFIAVVHYHNETLRTNVSFFNSQGTILYNKWMSGVSGIEFLPADKVVIATGTEWGLYNLTNNLTLIATGNLEGNTIGISPITAHPNKNMFFIVSLANQNGTGYKLQGIDSRNGSVLLESVFSGQPYWQPYRLAEVVSNDQINLMTTNEMIELRIRQ